MGAIASGGVRVMNVNVMSQISIPAEAVEAVAKREEMELMHVLRPPLSPKPGSPTGCRPSSPAAADRVWWGKR